MHIKTLTGLLVILSFVVVVETVYIFNNQRLSLPLRSQRVQLTMPAWAYNEVPGYVNFQNWHPMKEIKTFSYNIDWMFHNSLSRDLGNSTGVLTLPSGFKQGGIRM